MNKIFATCALAFVAACASEPPARFQAPTEQGSERVSIQFNSVSIRDVSLPVYAASEEIPVLNADGRVLSSATDLWADDPVRAITLDVARTLRDISGARVAPDPWPYQSRPEVVVDIRFEDLLPMADGTYRATGLYFVAPEEEGRAEHAHDFAFSVTYDPTAGYSGLARARAQLMRILTLDIANSALR